MLQISDWSQETKPDGSAKEVVYIDGGHHGNEHLERSLRFLSLNSTLKDGPLEKNPQSMC